MTKSAPPFGFTLVATRLGGRAGVITTPHGLVETPVFMPVGTQGSVKSLDTVDLESTGSRLILGNTYHLYLRPGSEVLEQSGGLHTFSNWSYPLLTDSGGFQVFSLGDHVTVDDEGATFVSHLDGSRHHFSPEKSMAVQRTIGADIIMTLDECTPDAADLASARQALTRTHHWAQRCVRTWEGWGRRTKHGRYQALFGIIQGGLHQDLRRQAATSLAELEFDGLAVGGETIGYNMDGTEQVMDWIESLMPIGKPRYAMGLGRDPQDVVQAVLMGFDMFDCVGPTRLARNGALYVGELDMTSVPFFVSSYPKARLAIGRASCATDHNLIQPGCDCYTCRQGYTRAYLHHLYRARELTYYRLASIHNIRTLIRLTEQLRSWILDQRDP